MMFDGLPDEEDGRVVAHQVPVPLLRVELDCEPPGVPGRVSRAALPAHRGEPHGQRGLLPHLAEYPGLAVLGDVVRYLFSPVRMLGRPSVKYFYLEITKGSGPLGVDHSLGDSLPVEVSELLDKDVVLQEYWPPGAHSDAVQLVRHRGAVGCGQLVRELNITTIRPRHHHAPH